MEQMERKTTVDGYIGFDGLVAVILLIMWCVGCNSLKLRYSLLNCCVKCRNIFFYLFFPSNKSTGLVEIMTC